MTWLRLDTKFFADPKIIVLDTSAKLLYLAGLCYAAEHLTDGNIPAPAVAILAAQAGAKPKAADALIAAALWTREGAQYRIANFAKHQTSRAEVEAKQKSNALRQAEHRAKKTRSNALLTRLDIDTDTDTDIWLERVENSKSVRPSPDTLSKLEKRYGKPAIRAELDAWTGWHATKNLPIPTDTDASFLLWMTRTRHPEHPPAPETFTPAARCHCGQLILDDRTCVDGHDHTDAELIDVA